jgi:hypothetical protein
VIVRILHEGQFEVPESALGTLEDADKRMLKAMEAEDEAGFAAALAEMISTVRDGGTPVDPATLVPSDLTVPDEGASMADVRALLASDEGAGG